MKGSLKKFVGGLKLISLGLPFAISAGVEASFIWLGCKGADDLNNTYEEIRQLPEVQEYINSDLEMLKSDVDNKLISNNEYLEKKSYYNSTEFIDTILKANNEEYQQYIDKIDENSQTELAGIICGVAFPIVAATAISMVYSCTNFVRNTIWSAETDFIAAKEAKEEKRKL